MKKIPSIFIVVLFILIYPEMASAQSSVTLYGVIDTGIEYQTNAQKTRHSVVQAGSGEVYGSLVGLTGSEDLGGGIKAIFKLEAGLNPNTGASLQGGRLFGRSAWVGLANDNNKIIFGRVYTPFYDVLLYLDPLLGSNVSLLTQDGGFTSRVDNGVRYTRTDGPFHENVVYSFGHDAVDAPLGTTAGAARNSKEISASIDYTTKTAMVALVYDDIHGPLVANQYQLGLFVPALSITAPTTGERAQRIAAAGRYTFKDTSLFAGYRHLRTIVDGQIQNSNLFWTGATEQLSAAWFVALGVYHQQVTGIDAKPTSVAFQTQYLLSKRTALYGNVGKVWNTAASNMGIDTQTQTLLGAGQLGASIGIYHKF
ncbi:porin Gram-negative type [Paraburkholderia atlantica]|uniref:Porin Gram-negative type n=1 Tax=Paraburkholderia atlantica TaxID=2654982 RepID=D5WFE6_PARAM|nr:porin [Paraburkholderia atlantica]ADG19300.1 porin Gram-negative type [Paraburkholderia atlantica]